MKTREKIIKRRIRQGFPIGWLIIGLLAFLAFFNSVSRAQIKNPLISSAGISDKRVERIESVGFTVSDMDKAIDFYTRVLPFEKVSETEVFGEPYEHLSGVFGARMRVVRLKLGNEFLELTEFLTPKGRPVPVDSRSNDRSFQHIAIIVSDMDKAYDRLRQNKVRHASTAPQVLPDWNKNAGGIKAFYFKDFDDHVLEILEFPPDKGLKKWHDPANSGKLFLGIDHTAIVVGDTAESLQFYRNNLGLSVAGKSENYGTEQEHLNNVFGAKLLITGLRTAQEDGIAVEFLEYLAPRDGKMFPDDTKASDLWHWQTSFETKKIDDLEFLLRRNRFDFISGGVIDLRENALGFKKGFLVRDTDGHAVRIIQK